MTVTAKDLPLLNECLSGISPECSLFGVQLGLLPEAMDNIEAQGAGKNLKICLQKALGVWMTMDEENRTWECVCEAVKKCDNKSLADQLRRDHEHELTKTLTEEHVGTLMKELGDIVPSWYIFCIHLGVSNTALAIIENDTTSKMRTHSMLVAWINQEGNNATIQKILEVLRSPVISNPALAKRLERDERIREILKRPLPSTAACLRVQPDGNGSDEDLKKVQCITIKEGDVGYSYEHVFSCCLDGNLKWVEVEDPYIKARHQVRNFAQFCELLVKRGGKKLEVKLHTGRGEKLEVKLHTGRGEPDQRRQLDELGSSLADHGVTLSVIYSDTLHDRQIRFSNGWIVKLGRGLDYFQKPQGQFSIGFSDYHLRPCHETSIEIFHKLNTKRLK